MRLLKLQIQYFRSIENVVLTLPENTPLILFGPNNSGKSNILRAVDILVGERWAPTTDFEDSDFFQRDRDGYSTFTLKAKFDENISKYTNVLCFSTNFCCQGSSNHENTYHDASNRKVFLRNDERERCQFILIDATRDLSRQFSYFSQYTILSKTAKRIHAALVEQQKEKLTEYFGKIQDLFLSVNEFKDFYTRLQNAFASTIEGFEHKLDIDLSAYDPNNYFKSLRITAKEGDQVRSFEEFGTGEQQVLLMAFVKAYAEVFKGDNFVLGIEEPEAHLHPLAQRWLAKNIQKLCESGIQVIVTTHSPEFLSVSNLEGLVRVYKENGLTHVVQHTTKTFAEHCIKLGANASKTTPESVIPFYEANTFYSQVSGFFSKVVLLVEGPSEKLSLPIFLRAGGFDPDKYGVEIIECGGKSQIARNYRLFTAYKYCVYCLFDADSSNAEKKRGNEELGTLFGFATTTLITDPKSFNVDPSNRFAYFGGTLESHLQSCIGNYSELERALGDIPKPLRAKEMARRCSTPLEFAMSLASSLKAITTPLGGDCVDDFGNDQKGEAANAE